MADQGDRNGILTVIADGLSGDQPANGEFVDIGPDTGLFEAAGQPIHAARKDRTQRAAEHVDARPRLGCGQRCGRRGRCRGIGRPGGRSGKGRIAVARQYVGGEQRPDHKCSKLSSIDHVLSGSRFRRSDTPHLGAGGGRRSNMIYRGRIGRICGAIHAPPQATEERISRVPPRSRCRVSPHRLHQAAASVRPVPIARTRLHRFRRSPSAA